MSPGDLKKRLRKRPFKPFRMYLTDGAAYDVKHPEMLLLGRESLVLGLAQDPAETLYDRTVDIDLWHIVRIEAIEIHAKDGSP